MNVKQAKAINLIEFLDRLWYRPERVRGYEAWYKSPLRDERTASFKVDGARGLWFDFGTGEGGTIVELVQALYRESDVSRVLATIAEIMGWTGRLPPCPLERPSENHREPPRIERVGPLSDAGLIDYLTRVRGIPIELGTRYLREIHYHVAGRDYRALGFPNESGGFELRNSSWKGTIGRKDCSYLDAPNRRDCVVFEGALDFLSSLAFFRKDRASANVLVLNSVALAERGAELLRERGIEHVAACLDHDPAGQAALETLRRELGGIPLTDASAWYAGAKDCNDYWLRECARRIPGR